MMQRTSEANDLYVTLTIRQKNNSQTQVNLTNRVFRCTLNKKRAYADTSVSRCEANFDIPVKNHILAMNNLVRNNLSIFLLEKYF